MLVSQASKNIMDNRFANLGIDINKGVTNKLLPYIEENMRLSQIELINSHWDNMDEATQKRALKTLKQIGG